MYKVLLVLRGKKDCMQFCAMDAIKQQESFSVEHQVKTGGEAIAYLDTHPVDLVIADTTLTDMSGLMLLKTILHKGMADAVILFGGRSDSNLARQSLMFGAFDYMIRPFDNLRLEDMLKRACSYLDEKKKNKERIDNLVRIVLDKVSYYYPKAQVAQIILHIGSGSEEAQRETVSMITQTRRALDNDIYKVSLIICHCMHEIICRVFYQNNWMHQFLRQQDLFELCAMEYEDWQSLTNMAEEISLRLCNCIRSLALKHVENTTIRRLAEYVTAHLDKELSLEFLSEKLYISKTYLSELFKAKTGCAITEYLTRVKMEKARNIIITKQLKTKEVASMLGYKDFVYFSKIYKKYWGTPPGKLMKAQDEDFEII